MADARGIVYSIMLMPGKAAAQFRKASADVIVRYLGGDPSLVEETTAYHLAQERRPEDDLARVFGQAVESEAVKRKREELQLAELDERVKRARQQSIEDGLASLQRCGLPVDDSDKMRAKDCLNQITVLGRSRTPRATTRSARGSSCRSTVSATTASTADCGRRPRNPTWRTTWTTPSPTRTSTSTVNSCRPTSGMNRSSPPCSGP